MGTGSTSIFFPSSAPPISCSFDSVSPYHWHSFLSHQLSACPLHYIHESSLWSSFFPPTWHLVIRHPLSNILLLCTCPLWLCLQTALLTSIEMLNLFSSTHLFFCQHHHLQTIHHSMSHISSISSSFHRPSTLISSSVLNHANQLLCQSTCTSSLFFSVQPCIQLTISCVLCFCSSTAAPFFFVILFLQMRSCTFSFHHQNLIVYSPQSRGYTK